MTKHDSLLTGSVAEIIAEIAAEEDAARLVASLRELDDLKSTHNEDWVNLVGRALTFRL